jgi:lipopolysaccharide transport system ATP-binding protein
MSPVIQSVKLVGAAGEVTTTVPAGGACSIEIGYELNQPLVHPRFGIQCETITGERLFLLQTGIQGEPLPSLIERRGVVRCDIPELPLVPGMYTLSIGCASRGQQVDLLERAVQFDVVHGDYFGTGRLPSAIHGHLLLQATWRLGE